IELLGQNSNAVDQSKGEPRRRSNDYDKTEERQQDRCQAAAPAKMVNHPVIHRIERDCEHDAPDRNRDERADQRESEVEQKNENPDPVCTRDPRRRKPITARRNTIIARHLLSPTPPSTQRHSDPRTAVTPPPIGIPSG